VNFFCNVLNISRQQ